MNKYKKHTISKREKKKITKAISLYIQKREEIITAYLFGSFVGGQQFGDIDIGVLVLNELEDQLGYEFELEIELTELVKYSVDVRVLNKAPITFVQTVIRHGLIIIDNKPNMRSDFESYILRKYFDFAHFRRQYLAEVVNAPL
jgi:predicted nucleotidyltransferase